MADSNPDTDIHPSVIYLAPWCSECERDIDAADMAWCTEPHEPCPNCGKEAVCYERRHS